MMMSFQKKYSWLPGESVRNTTLERNAEGPFWDDRYHATAVENDDHLIRCLVYIDLNMVRAGVVKHPSQWLFVGYNEICRPKQRYSLINRHELINIGLDHKIGQNWIGTIV